MASSTTASNSSVVSRSPSRNQTDQHTRGELRDDLSEPSLVRINTSAPRRDRREGELHLQRLQRDRDRMPAQATGDSVDAVTLPGLHAIDYPDPHPEEPAIGIGNHGTRTAVLGVEVTNPPPGR